MENEKEFLVNLVRDPDQFSIEASDFLNRAAINFPYCTMLHLLKARAHQIQHRSEESPLLNIAAIYTPDRTVLFNLLNRPYAASLPLPISSSLSSAPSPINPISAPIPISYESLEVPSTFIPLTEHGLLVNNAEKHAFGPSSGETTPSNALLSNVENKAPNSIRQTFLFWLKRTQKGYFLSSGQVQRGLSRLDTSRPIHSSDELMTLEKNYQRNIFHLGAVSSGNGQNTVQFDLSKKEDQLIEKFLREDPQHISQFKPEKTDYAVEHQVEKASRDSSEIVSETLANIYYQQKLFEKAIMAYEKLILKMPEKKAYFVSLIDKIKSQPF